MYTPSKYSVKSTDEFLDIIRAKYPNNGELASLDVENLLTNVPVEQTIDIILDCVYKHEHLSPPKLNKTILKKTPTNLHN